MSDIYLRSRNRNKKKFNLLNKVNWILFVAIFIVSSIILYYVIRYKLFNFKNIHLLIYGIIFTVIVILFIFNRLKKAPKTIAVLSILYLIFSGYGGYTIYNLVSGFSQLQKTTQYSEQTMSVVVLNDSDISTINQLNNQTIYAPIHNDKENIDAIVGNIKEKVDVTVLVKDINSYTEAYKQLISGEIKAIILNSAFEEIIEQEEPDYRTRIKRIYEFVVKKEQSFDLFKPVDLKQKEDETVAFNVYVSGIDTFGPITSVSRTDVNIIMSVNTKTGKVLLTTTPRDAYVRIAGGGQNQYDKLTHSGIYGVQSSIATLENLYGITLNYYARINFTSFMNLIDIVGGVEVYNDEAFVSRYGGYSFPVGNIYLTSDKALGFVRERYSLTNGDRDRAKNQQKVIAAILKKLTSSAMLTQASEITNKLVNALQTNMPLDVLMTIINQQVDTNKELLVDSQALNVTGTMGLPSYAMPGYNLYMGVVNETSLFNVSQNIKDLLDE